MPIMFCTKCGFPVADGFHDFSKVCECVPISVQKKRDKVMGWNTKYPKTEAAK